MRLLEVSAKAYYRDVSFRAWQQGQYNYVAFSVVMANAFAKKGANKQEYPTWKDPMEKYETKKPHITVENIEEEFRKQQIEQNAWLFNK
jgi:hypothetical protein